MPDYQQARLIKGATKDEQATVDRAWHLVECLDRSKVPPLREALELLVELLEERHRGRQGSELWQQPTECDD